MTGWPDSYAAFTGSKSVDCVHSVARSAPRWPVKHEKARQRIGDLAELLREGPFRPGHLPAQLGEGRRDADPLGSCT